MKRAILTVLGSASLAILTIYLIDQGASDPAVVESPLAIESTNSMPPPIESVPQETQDPIEFQPEEVREPEGPSLEEAWARRMDLSADEAAWMQVPFEERERRFQVKGRDLEWAPAMERAITEEIWAWDQPPVLPLRVECRVTLCKIVMFWPPNPNMPDMGQQLSYLNRLGIDHQGETDGFEEANGYQWTVIARRK
jgi:hypothetical protein